MNAMLCYHRLGTQQCELFRSEYGATLSLGIAEDIVVLKDDTHPTWFWSTGIAEVNRRYLEVYISPDTSKVGALVASLAVH